MSQQYKQLPRHHRQLTVHHVFGSFIVHRGFKLSVCQTRSLSSEQEVTSTMANYTSLSIQNIVVKKETVISVSAGHLPCSGQPSGFLSVSSDYGVFSLLLL